MVARLYVRKSDKEARTTTLMGRTTLIELEAGCPVFAELQFGVRDGIGDDWNFR